MTVDELIGQMAENRAWIAGARVAIDFGDDGAVSVSRKASGARNWGSQQTHISPLAGPTGWR